MLKFGFAMFDIGFGVFEFTCCVRGLDIGMLGLEVQMWDVKLGVLVIEYGNLDLRVFWLQFWNLDL